MNFKLTYFFCLFCLAFSFGYSQNVGIGTTTPDASSILELNSSTLGFLVPRMTAVQKTAIAAPATGLLIYQTDGTAGFWYFDGTVWAQFGGGSVEKIDDLIDGKSDFDGSQNYSSVFLGYQAGQNDDLSDNQNTGTGYQALYSNTTGYFNTANGMYALYSNTTGWHNTANGSQALYSNTTGRFNTANGYVALFNNSTGRYNTANGYLALFNNTTGQYNTANGYAALYSNTTGSFNTANGMHALYSNTTGQYNTANGYIAFFNGGAYSNSTALGYNAAISASNEVQIGDANVTSIGGYVGWSNVSDARFKTNIKENVPGLAFINQLKPVTYNLDVEKVNQFLGLPDSITKADEFLVESMKQKSEMIQSGFLAQDVEKAANTLGYDFSGVDKPKNDKDHYGLRYAEFVVPLVKAVQELSTENKTIKEENTELKKDNSEMKTKINKVEKENQELKEKVDWIMSQMKK